MPDPFRALTTMKELLKSGPRLAPPPPQQNEEDQQHRELVRYLIAEEPPEPSTARRRYDDAIERGVAMLRSGATPAAVQSAARKIYHPMYADPDADVYLPRENFHPPEVPESLSERAIKAAAKRSTQFIPGSDSVYLEQYLHPDIDILPKQELRPSRATVPPGLAVRRAYVDPVTGERDVEGLGQSTITHPEDMSYESLYDIWDFETDTPLTQREPSKSLLGPAKESIARMLMRRAGKPFVVYERDDIPPEDRAALREAIDAEREAEKNAKIEKLYKGEAGPVPKAERAPSKSRK